MKKKKDKLSCTDCSVQSCYRQDKEFPCMCLTAQADTEELSKVLSIYRKSGIDRTMAMSAAEIEGKFYGKITRVEEIVQFAKSIGAKKIGIAACIGLIEEAKIFCKILEANELEYFSVVCKVGSVDKTEIGLSADLKVQKSTFEAMCNPIFQAKLMNKEKTDLNVVVGLCVGHDSLFIKYSKAPITTLITKDRVLGHNPAAALYTSKFYYKRLLQKQ